MSKVCLQPQLLVWHEQNTCRELSAEHPPSTITSFLQTQWKSETAAVSPSGCSPICLSLPWRQRRKRFIKKLSANEPKLTTGFEPIKGKQHFTFFLALKTKRRSMIHKQNFWVLVYRLTRIFLRKNRAASIHRTNRGKTCTRNSRNISNFHSKFQYIFSKAIK